MAISFIINRDTSASKGIIVNVSLDVSGDYHLLWFLLEKYIRITQSVPPFEGKFRSAAFRSSGEKMVFSFVTKGNPLIGIKNLVKFLLTHRISPEEEKLVGKGNYAGITKQVSAATITLSGALGKNYQDAAVLGKEVIVRLATIPQVTRKDFARGDAVTFTKTGVYEKMPGAWGKVVLEQYLRMSGYTGITKYSAKAFTTESWSEYSIIPCNSFVIGAVHAACKGSISKERDNLVTSEKVTERILDKPGLAKLIKTIV